MKTDLEMNLEMRDLVANLTDNQIEILMYQLSRSGRVVIPQYYTPNTIKELAEMWDLNVDPTEEVISLTQQNFEFDCDLMEIIDEKLYIHLSLEDLED